LRFAGALTEPRSDPRAGGPYYSMPVQGGEVLLQLGAYIEDLERWLPPGFDPEVLPPEIWAMLQAGLNDMSKPLGRVKVQIYSREDPSQVLYSFDGDWQSFAAQTNAEARFSGPRAILINVHLNVPPGETWWIGKIEAYSGSFRGHADMYLIQGGLDAWIAAHGGTW
jgi:hypothetical protein